MTQNQSGDAPLKRLWKENLALVENLLLDASITQEEASVVLQAMIYLKAFPDRTVAQAIDHTRMVHDL